MDLADDPALRAAIEAARAWGVPLSRFLGREPATVHHYDASGRLVRSTRESEWTADDREAAMALLAYEADLCPGCRQPLAETTLAGNEERYVASVAARCHRCTAVAIVSEKVQDRPHASALLIGVELRSATARDHHEDDPDQDGNASYAEHQHGA
jgi:hypothetical protein